MSPNNAEPQASRPPTNAWNSTQARAASLTRWAMEPDLTRATQTARSAFLASFDILVDPESKLSPQERHKRAQRALTAHMLTMASKSVASRKRKAAQRARELEEELEAVQGDEVDEPQPASVVSLVTAQDERPEQAGQTRGQRRASASREGP